MEETVETKVPSQDKAARRKSPVERIKRALSRLSGSSSNNENKIPVDLTQHTSPLSGIIPKEWLEGDYQKKE